MKKILIYFIGVFLGFLVYSCIPNPNTSQLNNNTIIGPRIIDHIDSAGVSKVKYLSSNTGVLQKVYVHDQSNNMGVHDVYYNNGKVNKIFFGDGQKIFTELYLTYDATGKIVSSNQKNFDYTNASSVGVLQSVSDSQFTYSGAKLTQVLKKNAVASSGLGNYIHYENVSINYTGNNVSSVVSDFGVINNGVLSAAIYNLNCTFDQFDNKINPNTTLPKEYLIGIGALYFASFGALSDNNYRKTKILENGAVVYESANFDYVYDSENYPTIAQPGNQKFFYKAL